MSMIRLSLRYECDLQYMWFSNCLRIGRFCADQGFEWIWVVGVIDEIGVSFWQDGQVQWGSERQWRREG